MANACWVRVCLLESSAYSYSAEDRGRAVLQNIGKLLLDCMVSHPKRYTIYDIRTTSWEPKISPLISLYLSDISRCNQATSHNYECRFTMMDMNGQTWSIMKSSVLWNITLCRPVMVSRRFRRTCCFHLQGQRMSQARNQQDGGSNRNVGWLSAYYTVSYPWR
jgi:hypothetical protein